MLAAQAFSQLSVAQCLHVHSMRPENRRPSVGTERRTVGLWLAARSSRQSRGPRTRESRSGSSSALAVLVVGLRTSLSCGSLFPAQPLSTSGDTSMLAGASSLSVGSEDEPAGLAGFGRRMPLFRPFPPDTFPPFAQPRAIAPGRPAAAPRRTDGRDSSARYGRR